MIRTGFSNTLRRAFFVAFVIAGLCVILGSPSSAETVSDYNRLLDSTASTLNQAIQLERTRPGSAQGVLDRLLITIPSKMAVTTSDGTIDADLSSIRTDLQRLGHAKGKQRVGKLTSLAGRVDAMRSVTRKVAVIDPTARTKADAKLKQILAGAEYQPSKADSIREWFGKLLANLFKNMAVSPVVGDVIAWTVLGLLLIALVALLVFIALRVIAYCSVKKPGSVRSAAPHSVRRKAPSPVSALETAEKQASEGHYREAYRSAYLAAILTLDKSKLVKYVDGTTNWEYLRALSRQADTAPVEVFQDMTTSFDELIYGKREVSHEDYRVCVAKYRSLEEVVK